MALITPDELRRHIQVAIIDDELTAVIAEEEAELVRRFGDHLTASETFTTVAKGSVPKWVVLQYLTLQRPASGITSVTERTYDDTLTLDASDYRIYPGNAYLVERRGDGTNPHSYWGHEISIEYTPRDENVLRRAVLIDVLKLRLMYTGVVYQKTPEITIQSGDYVLEREKLLRRLRRRPVLA